MTAVSVRPDDAGKGGAGARRDAPIRELPVPVLFAGRAVAILWRDRKARLGLLMLGGFVAVAVAAPALARYAPASTAFPPYLDPGAAHWLGTNAAGQDVFSQVVYGSRISLLVGLGAGLGASVIAVTLGLIAGYRPGAVDDVLSFCTNLVLVIPGIPLMIILAAYVPDRSVWTIVAVVTFTSWATGARVIRSQAATLRERDFVTAAAFSGERLGRIVFREILPNMTSLVAVNFFAAANAAVLAEASLEFLGLGNPAAVSWGTILYNAQQQDALLTGQWLIVFVPGLAIALLATSFTLINFGVDALSNPRLREK